MSHKEDLSTPAPARAWTTPEQYLGAMARKRRARRERGDRGDKPRTQPEAPRLLLSTVPFVALMALLAVLAVAIMVAAFPGNRPPPKRAQAVQHEQGTAPRGWLEEARKEMH